MEEALRARVIAAGPAVSSRVYWGVRPQNSAFPAIVLSTVSDVRTQHMAGFDGYQAKRVQFDCYATTYTQAIEMREAVIAGIVPEAIVDDVRFLRGFVNNTLTRGADTSTGYIHRQMIDLTIWHGAAVDTPPADGGQFDFSDADNSGLLALILEDA